jgi:tetratricopeptide (TPR) repeat protein
MLLVSMVVWLSFSLQAGQSGPRAAPEGEIARRFEEAQRAFHAGELDRAVAAYKDVLRLQPGLVAARMNLGLVYFSTGDYEHASAEMMRVLEAQPALAPAAVILGLSYMKLGSPQRAVAPLRRAVRLAPSDREARAALAACDQAIQNYREAAEQFRALFALESDPELALFQLGHNYLALSKHVMERLVRQPRAASRIHRLKADLLAERSLWNEAEQEYRKAIALDPAQPGLPAALAYVLVNQGRADELARQSGGTVGSRDPAVLAKDAIGQRCSSGTDQDCAARLRSKRVLSAAEHIVLGKALLRMGEDEPSSDQFADALALKTDDAEATYWLVRSYARLSEAVFAKLFAAFPDSARTHQLRAETLQVREAYPEAIEEYKAAIRLRPQDTELYEALGGLYLMTRSFAEARDTLETAERLGPTGRILHLLGRVYLGLDLPNRAAPYLEKAVHSEPDLLEAHADLGRAYLQTSKPELAARELKQAAPLDRSGDLHYLLYQCYTALGQSRLASDALAQSRALRKAAFAGDRTKLAGASEAEPPIEK